jgi:perosamine synthetase
MDAARPPLALSAPNIGDAERALVDKALRSPDIAYGPIVVDFEHALAAELGRRHAIALISGTAALHLALLAVGVQPSDEVLMPTLTFVAPANAVRYVGAHPVLFDAEPRYRQMDLERFCAWLRGTCVATPSGAMNHRTRRRVAAVIAVDLLGHPTDIAALREHVAPYKIPIVDDAAEALGARAHGKPIGMGADIVCLSFNANKIVTTGGGGMLLCDDDELASRVWHLASQAKERGDAYDHSEVGFNYRLPSAASALGLGQYQRLSEFVKRKREISARYRTALADVPGLRPPREAPWAYSTDWLYTMHIVEELGLDGGSLRAALNERGVQTRPIFTPLHLTRAHAGTQAHECPVAEELYRTGVTLPCSTAMTSAQHAGVIAAVRAVTATVSAAPVLRSS